MGPRSDREPVERFRRALGEGRSPDLADYLPPPAEERPGRPKTKPVKARPTGGDGTEKTLGIGDGRFRILRRIGGGQFGEVFRAEAPGGVEVALKQIFRPVDDRSSQRELEALE